MHLLFLCSQAYSCNEYHNNINLKQAVQINNYSRGVLIKKIFKH